MANYEVFKLQIIDQDVVIPQKLTLEEHQDYFKEKVKQLSSIFVSGERIFLTSKEFHKSYEALVFRRGDIVLLQLSNKGKETIWEDFDPYTVDSSPYGVVLFDFRNNNNNYVLVQKSHAFNYKLESERNKIEVCISDMLMCKPGANITIQLNLLINPDNYWKIINDYQIKHNQRIVGFYLDLPDPNRVGPIDGLTARELTFLQVNREITDAMQGCNSQFHLMASANGAIRLEHAREDFPNIVRVALKNGYNLYTYFADKTLMRSDESVHAYKNIGKNAIDQFLKGYNIDEETGKHVEIVNDSDYMLYKIIDSAKDEFKDHYEVRPTKPERKKRN